MREINEKDYRELVNLGSKILNGNEQVILKALNLVSEKFIHTKDTFRRKQDMEEVCVAVALFARSLNRLD